MSKFVLASALALAMGLCVPAARAEEPSPVPDDARALAEALQRKVATANLARQQPDTHVAERASANTMSDETPLGSALRLAGLAIAAAIAIAGGTFVTRRLKRREFKVPDASKLEVLESMWIGRGQRVVLVNATGVRVLIGATGNAMQTLAILRDEDDAKTEREPTSRPAKKKGPDDDVVFDTMVRDELVRAVKPSRDERRRLLQRLNTL